MKAFAVSTKTFKEIARDRRALGFLLLFPIIFVVVFGSATFGVGQATAPHRVAVINEDEGTWILNNTTWEFRNFGSEFTGILENATYENSTTHVFEVFRISRLEADGKIANRNISAIMTIPANFSDGVRGQINKTIYETVSSAVLRALTSGNFTSNSTGGGFGNYTLPELDSHVIATVVIEGDFTYSEFASSQAYLQGFVEAFVDGVSQVATDAVLEALPPLLRVEIDTTDHIDARTRSIPGTEEFQVFDWMAPGLFIFATLLIALGVATGVARETEGGNIERLKLSKMRTADLMLGVLIPWATLGAVQVILLFGTAVLMGFHWQGGGPSIAFAVAVGSLSATAAVALGLLLSTAVKTERQAASIGPLVTVPLAFLTEAFFPISFTALVEGSPWGLAVRSMRGVLTFGLPFQTVITSMGWMAVQTCLLFAVAVFIFRRTRLAAE